MLGDEDLVDGGRGGLCAPGARARGHLAAGSRMNGGGADVGDGVVVGGVHRMREERGGVMGGPVLAETPERLNTSIVGCCRKTPPH